MKKFFFLDMETTGLDPETCEILEVAAVVTDSKLNVLDTYSRVIYGPPSVLAEMDEWCKTTHKNSGLLAESHKTDTHVLEVQDDLIRLKRKHFPVEKPPISGSSVHFDKRFIDKHMTLLAREFSHRIIDVSSFMGALSNYHDFTIDARPTSHRALSDIMDSIHYLKSYLERFNG